MFDGSPNITTARTETALPPPDEDLQDFASIRTYVRYGKMRWSRITSRRNIRLINEDLVSRKQAGEHLGKPFPLHENVFFKSPDYNKRIFDRFKKELKSEAINGLQQKTPSDSAHRILSLPQQLLTLILLAALIAGLVSKPVATLVF